MGDVLPTCGFPRRLSGPDVRLAYGQRPDGTIAHISEVSSGLACGCVCPGCGASLVARKGDRNEHHFGHHSTAECAHALESALHKLAKEVLHTQREILLPEVGAEVQGRTLIIHPADVHRFDDAILEYSLGAIVPDVIVRKGDHRLLVEMFVTHRCGPEKIAQVRAMGLSCVEVDLRKLSRRATREEVEHALLEDARRYWIHNPKLGIAAARLERQIVSEAEAAQRKADAARAENAKRLDRLAAEIALNLKADRPPPRATPTDTMLKVTQHGFGQFLGAPIDGDWCFRVPPEEWQAEVVNRFVLAPLEQRAASYYDFHASDVLRHLKSHGMLNLAAPGFVSKDDEAALVKRVPGYRTPYRVVEGFLWRLHNEDVLTTARNSRWAVAGKAERVWSDRRRRAEELQRWRTEVRVSVAHILKKVVESELAGFDLERWWRRRHPRFGLSFAEGFKTDDRRLNDLAFVVYQVEAMLLRNGAVVEDVLALPVGGAIEREVRSRQEKAEALRRQAAAAKQRRSEERVETLRNAGWAGLQHQAAAWLNNPLEALGTTPLEAAAASEEGLDVAREMLRRHIIDVERMRMLNSLRGRLQSLASQMRRPDHARVFLTSPNPEFGGKRPIDYCVDERTLERIRKAMTTIAR